MNSCDRRGTEVTAFDIHVTESVKLYTIQNVGDSQTDFEKVCTDCCLWIPEMD